MSISQVMDVFQATMIVALKVGGPVLIVGIIVGLIISVFQAVTQIHEQTLTFVPKLLAMILVLILLGPWMIELMKDFTIYIFDAALKMV